VTDQEMNREIAEALTAQGFEEGLAWEIQDKYIGTPDGHMILVPHDFTDTRYLLPAVEEYAKRFVIFRMDTYRARHDGLWNGFLGVDYGNSDGDHKGRETYPARGASYCEALRNAFHAALTGGAQ